MTGGATLRGMSTAAATCGVCGQGDLEIAWTLPNLPLTETYGTFVADYPNFDQDVRVCGGCGHFQLGMRVDPSFLYSDENYAYKSVGFKRVEEEGLFVSFISSFVPNSVKNILEIGANDLSLAEQLSTLGKQVFAVDPLVGDAPKGSRVQGFRMMAEDFIQSTTEEFDLVVARHTLEHVDDPRLLLAKLFEKVSSKGVIALEFPSLDLIVSSLRGDAFFHQHYHYYDLSSVQKLAKEVGVNLLGFWQNRQGSNGGSIMVALGRDGTRAGQQSFAKGTATAFGTASPSERARGFERFKSHFLGQMETLASLVESNQPIVGIGAGLMTPVLDYHLHGAIGRLPMILDDDAQKHGTAFRNLNVQIALPDKAALPEGFSALITSLENPKPIFRRAIELGAQKILGLPIA